MAMASPTPTDVLLRPAAIARAWMGPGRPQETIAVPGVVLGPGEALLRVDLVTIAEDDLAVADGDEECPAPTVLGREFVGRVAALGGRVDAADGTALELGERVVCAPRPRERIAAHRELVGGFATHVHVPAGTPIVRVGEVLPACILAPVPGVVSRVAGLLREAEQRVDLEDVDLTVTGAGVDPLVLAAMATERGAAVSIASADPRVRSRAHRFGAAVIAERAAVRGLRATVQPRHDVGGAFTLFAPDCAPADLATAVAFMRSLGTRRYPFADLVSAPLPLDRLDEAIGLARSGTFLRVAIAPGA